MTTSLLLLSTLLSLSPAAPAATTAAPAAPARPPGMYREHQWDLYHIHADLNRLKEDSQHEIMALNEQVREIRDQEGSLLSRLLILRQSARSMDCYVQQTMERLRQWEETYNRQPDPPVHKLFHAEFTPHEIAKNRALARKLFYMEIMYHHWSWETEREQHLNYDIFNGMSMILTNGDHDPLLLGIAWTEVLGTELWPFLR
jgi:hypothetical protein